MARKAPIATAWEFDKLLPDVEDTTAELLSIRPALTDIEAGLEKIESFREWNQLHDAYARGFFRGVAWARHRAEVESAR